MRWLPVVSICFIMFLAACGSREEQHVITQADIRFPDPEREAIVANGIAQIEAYDTAECFKLFASGRSKFGLALNRWEGDATPFMGQLLEERFYDSSGNRTYYWCNKSMMMMCGYGICPNELRDASGRLVYTWKREPGQGCDTFWYCLTKPENTFLAIRHSFRDRDDSRDTTAYAVDDHGRPIKGTHYSRYWDDTGWNYTDFDTILYTYDDTLLIQKQVHYCTTDEPAYNWKLTERYYYKNSHLDSMSSFQEYPNKRWTMMDIHEYVKYDVRGLPMRGLIADSLHVYYRYKKHGDPTIPDYSGW